MWKEANKPLPASTKSAAPSSPSYSHTVTSSDTRPPTSPSTSDPAPAQLEQSAPAIEQRKPSPTRSKRRLEKQDDFPRKRPRRNKAPSSDLIDDTSSSSPSATPSSITASPLRLSSLDLPSAMPGKLLPVLEMFKTITHEKWTMLVSKWLQFEASHNFQGKLSASGRPACVGDWIARARSPNWRPIPSKSLGEHVETWWAGMQPEFRTADDGRLLESCREVGIADNWEHLRHAGVNGLVSVVAALFFWYCSLPLFGQGRLPAHRQRAAMERAETSWIDVVIDVTWVFEHLARLPPCR
jgi:hypothetical protein